MRLTTCLVILLSLLFFSLPVSAVEVAPRISDKEIIERLARLEAGQKNLEQQINDLKESTNRQFDNINKRFEDINRRFDILEWMFGLFITVSLFLIGIMGKVLWNQQKRLTRIETSLETQKDELLFFKGIIEKLLPPQKGTL